MKARHGTRRGVRFNTRPALRPICEAVESRVLLSASVQTGNATPLSSTGATLNGTVNAGGSTVTADFEYSTSTSFDPAVQTPTTVAASPASVTGSSQTQVSASLVGLMPGTTYYYRLETVGGAGTVDGSTQSFTTLVVPSVTTSAATGVSLSAATLNGSVNSNASTDSTAFQYSAYSSFPTTAFRVLSNNFNVLNSVAIDAAGNVYASDGATNDVVKVQPDGTLTTLATGFSDPYGLAVDAAGDVFVANANGGVVDKILPTGVVVIAAGGFANPYGVAVDSSGDLYVADTGNNAVEEITPDGQQTTLGSGFIQPSDVAVDSSGDVFVADRGNQAITEIQSDGTLRTLQSGFSSPIGVAVDPAGDVFVGDPSYTGVDEILANGTMINTGSADVGAADSVAVDPAGNVYVADTNGNQVSELSPVSTASTPASVSGATTTSISASLSGLPQGTTYYYRAVASGPNGIAVGTTQSFTTVANTLIAAPPLSIPYGTALANSQVDGVVSAVVNGVTIYNIPGTFSFTSAAGTVLPAGNHPNIAISFVPADPASFTSATGTMGVYVIPGAATITLSNLNPTYNGSAHFAAATTVPSGLGTTITYSLNGSPVANPTQPGSYVVTASINDPNYTGTTTGNLVIARASAFIGLSNLTQSYSGSVDAPTVGTVPGGLPTVLTYSLNGSPVVHPTQPGTYLVTASINSPDYSGTATGTLVITQATASIGLSNLNPTYNGSAQFAMASTVPSGLATTLTYSMSGAPVATPTEPGTYAITASIDDPDYSGTATGMLMIAKASASISLTDLRQTYSGSPELATVSTTPDNLAVTVGYTQNGVPVASPTAAGSYDLTATINDADYAGSATATLVINPTAPPNPVLSLEQAYLLLKASRHTYGGHRIAAMRSLRSAIESLGGEIGGDGSGRVSRQLSDSQIQQAQTILQTDQPLAKAVGASIGQKVSLALTQVAKALLHCLS